MRINHLQQLVSNSGSPSQPTLSAYSVGVMPNLNWL